MIHFTDYELDGFINEDVPYFDLTTELLEIKSVESTITYIARENTVVCGTEEVVRIFQKLGIKVLNYIISGNKANKGDVLIKGQGRADKIHLAWKVCVNILEYGSGIATRTFALCTAAKEGNDKISVGVTRKIFPGTKKISIKGIMCGGAIPHRLGLSETILIFDEHIRLLGGFDKLEKKLKSIEHKTVEKKIEIEVHNLEDALRCANIGVDVLQVDKMPFDELRDLVIKVKALNPKIKVAAAGGVNALNAKEYAATGVDILITSAVYFGKPSDIKADIQPV